MKILPSESAMANNNSPIASFSRGQILWHDPVLYSSPGSSIIRHWQQYIAWLWEPQMEKAYHLEYQKTLLCSGIGFQDHQDRFFQRNSEKTKPRKDHMRTGESRKWQCWVISIRCKDRQCTVKLGWSYRGMILISRGVTEAPRFRTPRKWGLWAAKITAYRLQNKPSGS